MLMQNPIGLSVRQLSWPNWGLSLRLPPIFCRRLHKPEPISTGAVYSEEKVCRMRKAVSKRDVAFKGPSLVSAVPSLIYLPLGS